MIDTSKYNRIVFYDGECGFCNTSVQFILNKRTKKIFFAPLQSSFAEEILKKHNVTIEMDTIYYLLNGKLFNKSSAALKICLGLKHAYPLLFGFYIVPKFLRDFVYDNIAKRRHNIKPNYCVRPKTEEEELFIS